MALPPVPWVLRREFHAYRQASAELVAVIDGRFMTSMLFAPPGNPVVFSNRPGGPRCARIYGFEHLPADQTDTAELAHLSPLGDLAPLARWVQNLDRKDLAPWAARFGDVQWCGKADQPRPPAR